MGLDDVEETEKGAVYFDSSDLEMVFDDYDYINNITNGNQKIGLRFQNVKIPKGAIIDRAYIQFSSDRSNNENCEFFVTAETSIDAAAFEDTNRANVSSRLIFAQHVAWNPEPWVDSWHAGAAQQTPALNSLLQQLVDQEDWKQGNSLVFIICGSDVSLKDPGAKRVAQSFEGNPSAPPALIYTYTYDATLGVNNPTATTSFQIEVYPNPFTGRVNLKVPKGNKELQLEIYDMVGHQVFAKRTDGEESEVSITPQLSSGLYFIKVSDHTGKLKKIEKIIRK